MNYNGAKRSMLTLGIKQDVLFKDDLMLRTISLNFNCLKPKCACSTLEKGIASALVEAADKFRGIGD
jgi:hypothetical protein